MAEINFFNEDIAFAFNNEAKSIDWIAKSATSENSEISAINIIFCSDNYLLKINNEYLQHNYFTDVITFDYTEIIDDKRVIGGDLFISIDTVRSNSDEFGTKFEDELDRVIIHGVLHLIGYDDHEDSDRLEIRAKEDFYLNQRSWN